MRLDPLYRLRYRYPDGWGVALAGPQGREELDFYPAEGTCTGRIAGRFRGANHPRKRTDGTYAMDLQGVITTDDGATIMIDYQGFGRSRARSDELYARDGIAPAVARFRRQVVGFARHLAEAPQYASLNDSVCAIVGEVRVPPEVPADQLKQADVELVFDVAELVWERVEE